MDAEKERLRKIANEFRAKGIVHFVTDEEKENAKTQLSKEIIWFQQTRDLFYKFPSSLVFEEIYRALEVAAHRQLQETEKKLPKDFWRESWRIEKTPEEKKKETILVEGKNFTQVIKNYGIPHKGNMAVCPFHQDKDPSLSFSDSKLLFHCFGCGRSGDIVEFVRLMEEKREHEPHS